MAHNWWFGNNVVAEAITREDYLESITCKYMHVRTWSVIFFGQESYWISIQDGLKSIALGGLTRILASQISNSQLVVVKRKITTHCLIS